jgi:hypothetical protein
MIPVIQTVYGPNRGNCYSACFAMLLELDIDQVPCFVRDHRGRWMEAAQAWLGERGLMSLMINMPKEIQSGEDLRFLPLPECLCIATGRSPRGEFAHAVVGRIVDGYNFKMIHDPHPDGRGIVGQPVRLEFIMPRDPRGLSSYKVSEPSPAK